MKYWKARTGVMVSPGHLYHLLVRGIGHRRRLECVGARPRRYWAGWAMSNQSDNLLSIPRNFQPGRAFL